MLNQLTGQLMMAIGVVLYVPMFLMGRYNKCCSGTGMSQVAAETDAA